MINQIKFSHNWNNKLRQRIFTTIRSWNEGKEAYYDDAIGHDGEKRLK